MNQSVPVWHYDGQSAIRHEAWLIADEAGFEVQVGDDPGEHYCWEDLVFRAEKREGPVYGHVSRSGWQIGLTDPVPPALLTRLPKYKRYGGIIDRIGLWPASAALLAASAAVVFVVTQIPEYLAPLVPTSWEKRMGDAMIGDLGGRFCETPQSRAAIARLVKRLNPGGEPLDVRIANVAMVNAMALPGGKIVIFKGLITEAKSPDEVAGVIGHEIGHVRLRHVMQSLLRQLGLSVVLGGASGNTGGYLNMLISSSYSRNAESDADAYSIKAMRDGRISPLATAGFFDQLAKSEAKLGKGAAALGYVSSHPVSAEREKAYRTSHDRKAAYSAVIGEADWQAIKEACDKDSKVNKDDSLFF